MNRLLIALLLLAFPAPAAAAPFGELPFRPVAGGAACLRPTGAPGELVRWYEGGAEVLAVQSGGLVPVTRVPLGRRIACPVVASDANGAAILAASDRGRLRVALREPAGGWSAPFTLVSREVGQAAVAISARGDAVVAWTEGVGLRENGRLRVARRPGGGAFGPPETLDPSVSSSVFESLEAGIDASGEAIVMFTGEGTRARETVNVVIAPRGAPFGAPQRLGPGSLDTPALAVAADGRALVTVSAYDGLELYERPPGGRFGPRTILFEGSAHNQVIALRPGGAAAIAWQNTPGEDVIAVVRDGPAPFGPPIRVLDPPEPDFGDSGAIAFAVRDGGPPQESSEALSAALGADGRALLVWATEDRALGTATVTSSGRTEIGTLGSRLREPFGPSPLLLADGSRALAWTDDHSIFTSGPSAGRLHLALEGAPGSPASPAPQVTIGRPRRSALRPAQPLRLPVRCSAACDLRAWLPDHRQTFVNASLDRAGTVDLRFDPHLEAIAPARPGPISIIVQSGSPGATQPQRQTARVRLRRLAAPPLPHIEDLRVRRRGDDLVVRWRTDVRPRDAYQLVYATRTRDNERDPSPVYGEVTGRGRSFRVVLRDAARKRYVHVSVLQFAGRRARTETIRGPFNGR
jgi:hypothetical protein